jgi:transcriptional regulator with XRE-family HTH domain
VLPVSYGLGPSAALALPFLGAEAIICRVYSVDKYSSSWLVLVMELRETLARNLRKHRQAQRLSQEELGHRAELDRTYISSIERCVYSATVDVVGRIADALGIPALELLRPASETAEAKSSSAAAAEGASTKAQAKKGSKSARKSAAPAQRRAARKKPGP